MPPDSTNRKISSTTIDMITEQLSKKADDRGIRDVLAMHKEDIEEVKGIALSVKRDFQNRGCKQEDAVKDIMQTINGFKNIKLVGVGTIVVIVLGWASQFYTLKDTAEDTADNVTKVEQSVKTIKASTEQNAVMFKEHIKQAEVERKAEERAKEVETKKDKEDLDKLLDAIKKTRRR